MDKPLSRVCTCGVCSEQELTVQAPLPNEWAMLWEGSYILCKICLIKWTLRWGEPVIWLRGGEEPLL